MSSRLMGGRGDGRLRAGRNWGGHLTSLLLGLIVSDEGLLSLEWTGAFMETRGWHRKNNSHSFHGRKPGRLVAVFLAQPCVLGEESHCFAVLPLSGTWCFPVDSELRDISQNTFLSD